MKALSLQRQTERMTANDVATDRMLTPAEMGERTGVMQACDDSLRRLRLEHIDLYQTHFTDPLVQIEETLSAFTDLVRQGKVRYLGCSNFSAWRLMQSLWVADRHGYESFVSLQPEYHMLHPTRGDFEVELAGACSAYGIGVLPYSPLAGGMLTGKIRRDLPAPGSARADENIENRATRRIGTSLSRWWPLPTRLVKRRLRLQSTGFVRSRG
jgi:aryl-alcohol dehydrogenase-like predicted oxidoreductase